MTAVLPPWVIQASSHPADVFRRQSRFLAQGQQGVRPNVNGDLNVTANGTPNMSVNVAAGEVLVNGTQNTTSQGAYECLNDATVNLTIAASDPTNPRIDIVVAQVRDATYSGASNDWILAVVTGTPAPSPSPPATPANAIVLAQVAVAANVTTIVSGNITDKRPRFGNLFKARAKQLTTGQSLPNNTDTKISLNTIEFDPNGNFDAVTNFRYTAPVTGYYLVAGAVALSSAAPLFATIFKNGVAYQRGAQINPASGAVITETVKVMLLNNTDFIELFGTQNSGGALNTNAAAPIFSSLDVAWLGG